ncbi:MAG: hypothetical protein KKI08_01870 [Armatimonadetes bacterium]|nr:hypothetical protein [Armatimonadota bacterium]
MRANTDWFRDAKWGVFVHYLAGLPSADQPEGTTPESWNERIDALNVDGLARQLAEVQAGYFFITLGQNSGYILSPNATYDSLVRRDPSRLARRDLVADLIAALEPHGIPVMVYSPAHAPALDRLAVEGLKCTPTWDASCWQLKPGTYLIEGEVDTRLTEFQRNWEAILREWSLRWGKGCRGWWFDGCYKADLMYRSSDEPNFRSFAAAVKAGNPDSLVAFNPGVKVPVICYTEHEDYTAGEVAGEFPVLMDSMWGRERKPEQYWGMPIERFVDGAQYHLLTFMGPYWCRGVPRFPDELVIGYTKHINSLEGVISWDVPTHESGLIPEAFMAQLRALAKATR